MRGSEICECHGHIVLDGIDWKASLSRHKEKPDTEFIRKIMLDMKNAGITYYRDGGDKYGANTAARDMADEYGIEFACPVFAIHKNGCYGGMVGLGYDTLNDFRLLIEKLKSEKADFVKIMASGIISYNDYGVVTGGGAPFDEFRELVKIAHGEGFSVMVHCNSTEAVYNAVISGADSIEHGFFIDRRCVDAMLEYNTIWVPTHSTTTVLRGCELYPQEIIEQIIRSQAEMIRYAADAGALIASGSDAGARNLPHGKAIHEELASLEAAIGRDNYKSVIERGNKELKRRFPGRKQG